MLNMSDCQTGWAAGVAIVTAVNQLGNCKFKQNKSQNLFCIIGHRWRDSEGLLLDPRVCVHPAAVPGAHEVHRRPGARGEQGGRPMDILLPVGHLRTALPGGFVTLCKDRAPLKGPSQVV